VEKKKHCTKTRHPVLLREKGVNFRQPRQVVFATVPKNCGYEGAGKGSDEARSTNLLLASLERVTRCRKELETTPKRGTEALAERSGAGAIKRAGERPRNGEKKVGSNTGEKKAFSKKTDASPSPSPFWTKGHAHTDVKTRSPIGSEKKKPNSKKWGKVNRPYAREKEVR